jgi:hypothetical protein
MPEHKIKRMVKKFSKNLNCDWIIIWHFHVVRHYEVDGLDYFNTGDRLRNCSAVIEDLNWNLNSIRF